MVSQSQANAFASAPISWTIVGTGDFNGDERDDILWRSNTGQLSDWPGNANGGFSPNDANPATTVATNWIVQPRASCRKRDFSRWSVRRSAGA